MQQEANMPLSMENQNAKHDLHQEIVPFEFFNIKFWLVLLLIISSFFLLGTILNVIRNPSILGGITATLIIVGYVLLILGWRLWSSAKVSGFWLVFILIHLLFLTQGFMLATSIYHRKMLNKPTQVTFSDPFIPASAKEGILSAMRDDREAKKVETTAQISLHAIALFFIFYCFFLNLWSMRMLAFFKKLNGKCPLCKSGFLSKSGPLKKDKLWKCNACSYNLVWKGG